MADEQQVVRLRTVGPSQGQTPPVLTLLAPGYTSVPATTFAQVATTLNVQFPNRGAIFVVDHASARVDNQGTAGAAAGSFVNSFIQVRDTVSNNLLREWLMTPSSFSQGGSVASIAQATYTDEIDSLEAAPLQGTPITNINLVYVAIINNTSAGAINFQVTAILKYHFRLQQQ